MSIHKVIDKTFYSNTSFSLTLEKNNIEYTPGSCAVMFGKSYSFCSSPNNNDEIKFLIRRFENGNASSKLSNLKTGDFVEVEDTFTYFYPGQTDQPYCYIATGTGISPFISALTTYNTKPQAILYGAKTYDDLYFKMKLNNYCDHIHYAVSQPAFIDNRFPLRVTDILDKLPISDNIIYYICGIEGMITDVTKFLSDKGISYKNIQQELFYMKI